MQSIIEAIKIHSDNNPDKICVADYNGVVYSYSEYWKLVRKTALFFISKGLKKEECVIIESVQSGIFTAIVFGVQLAGGVAVPLENGVSKEKILKIKINTDSKFIVSNKNKLNDKAEILISDIVKYYESDNNESNEFIFPKESDLAEILFTTGTTGDSKGIMISHRANIALGQNISYGVEMKKNNIELIPVPINHSYGLRSFYANMYNGSSVVLLDGFSNIRNFFLAIEKYKVTSLALVPAMINMMLKISKDYIKKYSEQIDYVQSGSAVLLEDAKYKLIESLPNSRLYNFYGSTESGRCCVLDYSKERNKIGCIGKPAYNATFEIIGDDGKTILSSEDNIGRLACKGKMNMLGYWKSKNETNGIMDKDYILTNDLCYMKGDFIYYVGRKNDIINVGGKKVSPTEIENIANSYEGIQESVCVPIEDELMGQSSKLYLTLKKGVDFNKLDLLKYLSESMEDFKIPKKFEVIKEVPRMYNGKIDRKSLIK